MTKLLKTFLVLSLVATSLGIVLEGCGQSPTNTTPIGGVNSGSIGVFQGGLNQFNICGGNIAAMWAYNEYGGYGYGTSTGMPVGYNGSYGAGYPGTGYGYPNTGYPNTGYPNTGYPNTGYPNTGYPTLGYTGSAYPGNVAYNNICNQYNSVQGPKGPVCKVRVQIPLACLTTTGAYSPSESYYAPNMNYSSSYQSIDPANPQSGMDTIMQLKAGDIVDLEPSGNWCEETVNDHSGNFLWIIPYRFTTVSCSAQHSVSDPTEGVFISDGKQTYVAGEGPVRVQNDGVLKLGIAIPKGTYASTSGIWFNPYLTRCIDTAGNPSQCP